MMMLSGIFSPQNIEASSSVKALLRNVQILSDFFVEELEIVAW